MCAMSSVSESGDMDSKIHSVKKNPESRITLCKIYNIKKEKSNG